MNNHLIDKKVVLFGAGAMGIQMLGRLIATGHKPECFIDNNPVSSSIKYESRGIEYEVPVNTPDVLLVKNKSDLRIIITPLEPFNTEIELQIEKMGLKECLCREIELLPCHVCIEASTLCQLNCKTCYMRKHDYGTVGKGYLKFSNFKKFIDSHPYIKTVELSNSGEIFLNPDLLDIIKYAFERNVKLTAYNGVNFNTVSDEVIEGLVKYGFLGMTIAIDGVSQKTYSIYRRNGDYKKVIENINKLNKQKKYCNSEFPKLIWQYVIMDHNEEEVAQAKEIAKLLDMEINFKLSWDSDYAPKNREMLIVETGLNFLTREEYLLANPQQVARYFPCYSLWSSPHINWDGRLLGCCAVFQDDFGVNVFEVGLEKAMNSLNYKCAQNALKGKSPSVKNQKNTPCLSCHMYKEMVKKNAFIKPS